MFHNNEGKGCSCPWCFTSGHPSVLFVWTPVIFKPHGIFFLLCPQRSDGPYALVLVPTREVSSFMFGVNLEQVFSGTACWVYKRVYHFSLYCTNHCTLCFAREPFFWFLTRKIQALFENCKYGKAFPCYLKTNNTIRFCPLKRNLVTFLYFFPPT